MAISQTEATQVNTCCCSAGPLEHWGDPAKQSCPQSFQSTRVQNRCLGVTSWVACRGSQAPGRCDDLQNEAATLTWPSAPGRALPRNSRPRPSFLALPASGISHSPRRRHRRALPTRPGPSVGPGSTWTHGDPKPRTATSCGTRQKIYSRNFKNIFKL